MLKYINFFSTFFALAYLLKVFVDTKIDTFQQPINPREKEMFFIDPALNTNQALRYDQQCQMYQNLIMNPNTQKLGDVFNLSIDTMHNLSFYLLIVNLIILCFYLIVIISSVIIDISPNNGYIAIYVIFASSCITIIGMILGFILFAFMLYYYIGSDARAYSGFLSCRNVNYPGFDKFKIVKTFNFDFIVFSTLNIISMFCSFYSYRSKKNAQNEENA